MTWGDIAQSRLSDIAACSLPSDGVSRFPFTPHHAAALGVIRGWMEAAGLNVTMDAAATLVGHKDGAAGAPTFLIGSHQDTVRDGGRYDGIMGVALGCLALEKLAQDGVALPFAVEVLAFADEEGVRFPTALMGPRALAGTFQSDALALTDRDGIALRDALTQFGGCPEDLPSVARHPDDVAGYLEVHIEQGPVLEAQDTALGIVTGICGIERRSVTFTGETGHAGTVPMLGRQDALVAASDFVSQVHDRARTAGELRATIGALSLQPNVVNGIARQVDLTLEIRDLEDATRRDFADWATRLAHQIADKRNVQAAVARTYEQPAVPCDPVLMDALERAATAHCPTAPRLPSGATHDASAMADLCPIAMLFVRCKGGISHRPEEFASAADMGAAVETMAAFLQGLQVG